MELELVEYEGVDWEVSVVAEVVLALRYGS